ncbi:hypothetical protein [Lentzea albida]|uniref:hypothetical protein n=1 Tax=Lentzea albida TaxID=65499 RepID=UPI000B7F9C88|nr:hypothetical protein [Lentzea albida]
MSAGSDVGGAGGGPSGVWSGGADPSGAQSGSADPSGARSGGADPSSARASGADPSGAQSGSADPTAVPAETPSRSTTTTTTTLVARFALGAAGTAIGAWGAWLLLPQVTLELLLWLGGGVVLHDFLIAPLVGLTGLLVRRPSIGIGLVVTGVLTLVAVPLLWREHSGPVNPGLHDRDYPTGVAVVLALVWAAVVLYEVAAHLQKRRRAHEDHRVAD